MGTIETHANLETFFPQVELLKLSRSGILSLLKGKQRPQSLCNHCVILSKFSKYSLKGFIVSSELLAQTFDVMIVLEELELLQNWIPKFLYMAFIS